MSFYNTGNPVPSIDPRDLDDNAKHLDVAIHSAEDTWVDRLGATRKSIKGVENGLAVMQEGFDDFIDASEAEFNAFLANTQYEVPIAYTAGLSITRATQTVIVSGIVYRPIPGSLPFVTTTFGADAAKWAVLGDASLRQDLTNAADPLKGANVVVYGGSRSAPYIAKVGDALDGALIDASRFGVKGDGTNEGARIQAAFASGENIRFQRHMDLKTDRALVTSSERQIVDFGGAMLRPISDLGSAYILTLASNFSEIRELLLVNDSALNSKGVLHSGFRTSLVNPNITGTTLGHVVTHTGAEATLSGGKIKGGTQSGLFISAPDSNVQFVYIEGNGENGMQATVGSIVANNVHCYNNAKSGFRFTGADFSVFHQLYADTNGENGIHLDQTKNTEFYSAWGFKSNQSLASQKFELLLTDTCNGNTFYGFRAGHGSDAAKTTKAMDIGNSNNLFVGAYSQTQDILRRVDAGADITNAMFIESKGVLAKYNKQPHTDKKHLSLAATGSGSFSFSIMRSLSAISSDVFVFELEVVGRDAAGTGSLVIDKVIVPIAAGTTGSGINKTHVSGNDIFTYTLTSFGDNSVVIGVASSSASTAQLSGVLKPWTSARSTL